MTLKAVQLAQLLPKDCLEERTQALQHLDFAMREYKDMKMQSSLERALRHKQILKA